MSQEVIRSYKDLEMWRRAKDFAVVIYETTNTFPREEVYGLTAQLRRAAISIPSNIAEGFQRKFTKEKLQFLRIAYGSGAEIETQLLISTELEYLSSENYQNLNKDLGIIMRILNKVLNRLHV